MMFTEEHVSRYTLSLIRENIYPLVYRPSTISSFFQFPGRLTLGQIFEDARFRHILIF